jgi:hypothetical protein
MASFLQCNYAQAQELAEDGRRIAHAAGEEWAECLAVLQLGRVAVLRGNYVAAKRGLVKKCGVSSRTP